MRREARARDRQAAASSQNEAEESEATEEEATRERTTRVGRPRGGMKVAARIGERLRREERRTPKGERERFLEANKKCGTHSDLGSAACRLPAEAGVGKP